LAAAIRNELGIESEIKRGSGGIFLVTADNQQIFSKHDEGRFPTEKEVLDKLRALRG
jgi:selT/selW/selH-like putative selenoprotein